MTIYLYVKTHNQTGLKYLGKTKKDPFKYRGSGKDWIAHIKKYGYNVTTIVIKECITNTELSYWGRHYSKLWNVVSSNEWANRIPETGGGCRTGHNIGVNNPMYGRIREDLKSDDSPNKLPYRRAQNSTSSTNLWKKENHRQRMSKIRKQKWKDPAYLQKMQARKKTVKQVCIEGNTFHSLREAAVYLNLDPSTVSKRCSSTHQKFSNWKYLKDHSS